MSIRLHQCITIVCDACGDAGEDEDGYTPHYVDVDAAAEALGGPLSDPETWLITATEHVCPRCRAKQACAMVGHEWSDWTPGRVDGEPRAIRWCERDYCTALEHATEDEKPGGS